MVSSRNAASVAPVSLMIIDYWEMVSSRNAASVAPVSLMIIDYWEMVSSRNRTGAEKTNEKKL